MKKNLLLTMIVILWEALIGFSHLIGMFDLFLVVSVILFVRLEDIRKYLLWIVIFGFVIDIIRVELIGSNTIINGLSLIIIIIINSVIKIFGKDSKILFAAVYVVLGTLIKATLPILGGGEISVASIFSGLILNVFIVIVFTKLFNSNLDTKRIRV